MMRTQFVKLARAPIRSFSAAAVRAAEGDTGGVRAGGSASSDAFSKREAASENKFIRDKEMQNLRQLKEKLAAQKKHLEALEQDIDKMARESGGEHH